MELGGGAYARQLEKPAGGDFHHRLRRYMPWRLAAPPPPDYLLKTDPQGALAQASTHVRKLNRRAERRLSNVERRRREATSAPRARPRCKLVPVGEIVYFPRPIRNTSPCRSAWGVWLIEESLKALETEFAAAFTRIHRKALVAACAHRRAGT